MHLDFSNMTADQLRAEIARGNFPPIAGADDGTVEPVEAAEPEAAVEEAPAAEETPSMADILERAATPEEEAAPEAEIEEEAPAAEEEAEGEGIPLDQYNLALEIGLDEGHEQYEDALAIIDAYAPDAIKARYGLIEDELDFPDEEESEYPFLEEDEQTGIPEIDKALNKINQFNTEAEDQETQQQTEAQAAAEQAAAEAYQADYATLAGEDAPTDFSEMSAEQKLIAASLLGLDGTEGVEDPLVEAKSAFEAMKADIEKAAIADYVGGKREFTLPPITERNGSSTAPPLGSAKEGKAALEDVVRKHSGASNGVSG